MRSRVMGKYWKAIVVILPFVELLGSHLYNKPSNVQETGGSPSLILTLIANESEICCENNYHYCVDCLSLWSRTNRVVASCES